MKKDDDELEGMEPQEPAEDNSTDNGNASGTPAPEGGDGNDGDGDEPQAHSTYQVPKDKKLQLSGMYENWFLDYASYVILERAVPHIEDGFKPVQRRIMHAMKEADDGHFNKVANIVGLTMQYHPHGDASIYSALVQLGQKELLIDTQGNWGNILTGDGAAAGRYIEARLSEFALDAVYNPKVTDWGMSYDGRKREPLTLPAKFPLLLTQGAEGIAVGLSCKILPHNFNEVIDAAISYLRGEEFHLYPDFQTGGYIDVSHYNDGERGGNVRVRAKIEKLDNKTLLVKDVPYGKTTGNVIESILKAKGVPIQVHTIASMFTPYFSDEPVTNFDEVKRCDQKLFGEFYRQMRAQGVYLAPSAFETGMVSFVHTDEDFSRTLECAAKVRF